MPAIRNDAVSVRQRPNVLTTSAADECSAHNCLSNSRPAPEPKSSFPLALQFWLSQGLLDRPGYRCAKLCGGMFYLQLM
jgi:hypothetical protein